MAGVLRQDDRGGVHLHHDRRTSDLVTGFELRAVIDDRVDVLAVHESFLLTDNRRLRISAAFCERGTFDLDALALDGGAQRDDFVLTRQRKSEEPLVLRVELVGDRL